MSIPGIFTIVKSIEMIISKFFKGISIDVSFFLTKDCQNSSVIPDNPYRDTKDSRKFFGLGKSGSTYISGGRRSYNTGNIIVLYSIVRTFLFKIPKFRASTLMNISPYKGKFKEGQKRLPKWYSYTFFGT